MITRTHLLSVSLTAALFISLLLPANVFSASVAAQYQSIENGAVVFVISVGSPAPSSLIIQHYHPSDIAVTGTSPAASKINVKAGFAKWFFKNPQPGSYSFSLNLARTVPPESVRLVLRYKDPGSGALQEVVAQP
jgi:hypothetical protein